MIRALLAATAAALWLCAVIPSQASAARGLTTGFLDGVYGEADSATWIQRTTALNAGIVRVNVAWRDVAPSRPAVPQDPADTAYQWAGLDPVVRRLRSAGLDVLLTVYSAPAWAEGPNRRSSAPVGTWRPDPDDLGRFATALATRYSGDYGDLPKVRHYMAWNEPNLSTYLTPQWSRRGTSYRSSAPAHYRRMLLAFGPAVKGVARDNVVVAGSTAPYGDPNPGDRRMQPARFVRDWLCARRGRCSRQAFDVLSHHPYSVGRPTRRSLNDDDVSIPDLGKLTRLLRAARRRGTVAGKPKFWVGEVSYDSSPPDPDGIPAQRHARYLAQTMYLSWKQGASTLIWLQIRDSPPTPSYAASYQSGVYLRDGRPKPAARAFRFPFVVDGRRAWGKSPASGTVVIERRSGRRWVKVASARVSAGAVFTRRVKRVRGAAHRARVGKEVSLVWR